MPRQLDLLIRSFALAAAATLLIGAAGAEPAPGAPAESPPDKSPAPAPAATPAPAETTAEAKVDDGAFLRVVHDRDESSHLQVAVRKYTPKDGHGPEVSLVGVAHIGQKKFYRALQAVLDKHDVVLFESVKPEGAGGAGGSNDKERIASTKAAIRFVASIAELHHRRVGRYPASVEELTVFAGSVDPRLKSALATAMIDGWGAPLQYSVTDDKYTLISLGADGKPGPAPGAGAEPAAGAAEAGAGTGGGGADADFSAADLGPIAPLQRDHEDGLQSQLAKTLGLEFQLDAIDYDRPNWRCSDMSMDQVERAFKKAGLDFAPIGGTLAGSSLSGKMISFFLQLVRAADTFLEGALADVSKVMLIEVLGDESLTRQALRQFGAGFSNVIVDQRNQVAIDDLQTLVKNEPAVKTVAIFYGAAHMRDMVDRLTALGYEPHGEPQWIEAISVNTSQSKLTAKDIREMRLMIRQAIRQQFPKK